MPSIQENGHDRVWMSEHSLGLLVDASAQRAAREAAQSAVTTTFLVLGIDLNDEDQVRHTRDSMREMREHWHARRDRTRTVKSSVIHGFVTVALTAIVSCVTAIFTLHR